MWMDLISSLISTRSDVTERDKLTGVEDNRLWVEVSLTFNRKHFDWVAGAGCQVAECSGQVSLVFLPLLSVACDLEAVMADATRPAFPREDGALCGHVARVDFADETNWKREEDINGAKNPREKVPTQRRLKDLECILDWTSFLRLTPFFHQVLNLVGLNVSAELEAGYKMCFSFQHVTIKRLFRLVICCYEFLCLLLKNPIVQKRYAKCILALFVLFQSLECGLVGGGG